MVPYQIGARSSVFWGGQRRWRSPTVWAATGPNAPPPPGPITRWGGGMVGGGGLCWPSLALWPRSGATGEETTSLLLFFFGLFSSTLGELLPIHPLPLTPSTPPPPAFCPSTSSVRSIQVKRKRSRKAKRAERRPGWAEL